MNPYICHTTHQFPVYSWNTHTHARTSHTAAMIWSSPKWEQVCLSVWCLTVNEWESRLPKLLRKQCNCWGRLNHPVCWWTLLALCSLLTHTGAANAEKTQNRKSQKNSHQSKEQKPGWFVASVTISKIRKPNGCFALFCCLLLIFFFFTRFIYNAACIILQGCL